MEEELRQIIIYQRLYNLIIIATIKEDGRLDFGPCLPHFLLELPSSLVSSKDYNL
jgi:hypothetical protein